MEPLKIEPIPGFDAVKMKDELQAAVQAELAGMTPEEEVRYLNEQAENGPFGDLWRRMRPPQIRGEVAGVHALDALAEEAIRLDDAGETRPLREFAAEEGIDLGAGDDDLIRFEWEGRVIELEKLPANEYYGPQLKVTVWSKGAARTSYLTPSETETLAAWLLRKPEW